MTKFWMVAMITILALGSMTGCPDDGDDCASDPSLCDGSDPDTDAGADADADADSDTTENDADTSEVTSCPSVAGDWALTYDSSSTTIEEHYNLTLEQDGCSLTGSEEVGGDITGTISEDGSLSLRRNTGGYIRTLVGNLVSPSQLGGTWEDPALGASSTWYADRQ